MKILLPVGCAGGKGKLTASWLFPPLTEMEIISI
jgi:hypothetical protein